MTAGSWSPERMGREVEKKSSNADLATYLERSKTEDVHALIRLLKSRFSKRSLRLCERFKDVEIIPPPMTISRQQLSQEIVALLGWYGSNSIAYGYRKVRLRDGSKFYLGILNDVLRIFNNRLPKKERRKLARTGGVPDLEQRVVEMLLALRFHKKSTQELIQILEESGLEREVAEDLATRYGPAGLAGAGLPVLTKFLGKKTVMNIVQGLVVAIVGKFLGKEAAKQMAKRLAVVLTQKGLRRMINWIGWVLLASDAFLFLVSPARRITIKAVPFISLVRVRERLESGDYS